MLFALVDHVYAIKVRLILTLNRASLGVSRAALCSRLEEQERMRETAARVRLVALTTSDPADVLRGEEIAALLLQRVAARGPAIERSQARVDYLTHEIEEAERYLGKLARAR